MTKKFEFEVGLFFNLGPPERQCAGRLTRGAVQITIKMTISWLKGQQIR